MSALENFAVYLAQAHACTAVRSLDPSTYRPPQARALPVCHIHEPSTLAADGAILTALRETMCVAPAAIVVADAGAAARMQHPEALRCALTQAGLPVAFCGHAPA